MTRVTSDDLVDYLDASGWSLRGRLRSGATQWFRLRDHVLVPGADDPQAPRLLENAVTRIAESEDRAVHAVESDATAGYADRLVVRVESDSANVRRPSEVPFLFGVTLLQTIRELLAAAATRAGDGIARRPEETRRWRDALLSALTLEPTEEGSYVVPVLIQPSIAVPTRLATLSRLEAFGHRTSQRLQWIFREIESATETDVSRHVLTARPEVLEPMIRLLEAMPEGAVSFDVAFSPRWERQPPPSPAVSLAKADLPKLDAAMRTLIARGVAERAPARLPELEEPPKRREIEHFVLRGPVIALRRPVVTVEGIVDGETRRVRVTVDDDETYRRIAEAHADRRAVRVVGRLILRPRTAAAMEALSSVEIENMLE